MSLENRIIRLRRGSAASWQSNNPTLNEGEMGVELDTRRFKFGDGSNDWGTLPYATQGNSGGLYAPNDTGTPTLLTSGTSVPVSNVTREYQFIAGSGGPVTISASPVIQAGSVVGQELILEGTSDANKVTLPQSGAGIDLNGTIIMVNKSRLSLVWNGSTWGEVSRK